MKIHSQRHLKEEQIYQECLNTCLSVSKWLRFTLFSEMVLCVILIMTTTSIMLI